MSSAESKEEALAKIKLHPSTESKKIDLLPAVVFIAIAYFILVFRYITLTGRYREFYLFAGATGFISLAIFVTIPTERDIITNN